MRPTIHASAVLIGAKAVLIRGPSGAGKSSLAFDLIQAAKSGDLPGSLPFARLVADDRVLVEAHSGRLLVRPAPALAGLIEIHGLGIRTLPHEELAVVGLIVDLAASDGARLPAQESEKTEISGIRLPRLAVAAGHPALPTVLGFLATSPGTAATGD
jgi:serine kinase of HPr protein (carbohydrate metabolism regulator)